MKSLAQKLGWVEGKRAFCIGCPADLLDLLAMPSADAPEVTDVLLIFVNDRAKLSRVAASAVSAYRKGSALWFAHPKKSGRLYRDLGRDEGWDVLAAFDLLPVTQIAIDADWSALRFRYRSEIRSLTRKSDFPS